MAAKESDPKAGVKKPPEMFLSRLWWLL